MRANKIRELLKADKPTLGTHIHSMWPAVVEAVGHSGMFDYVEFVGEYAPYDLFSLDNFCRTVELFDMSCMIKLDQAPRSWLAQRAIGAGFQSVLFADCRTVEDVQECVHVVRPDTPEDGGTFGCTSRRMTYMEYGGEWTYVQALRDVVVAIMVEKKGVVEHLEEVLAVPGIDMVQWGPADYCMSIGRPGAWYDPDIKVIERKVIDTALKMGIPPRIEINSPEAAKYYLDLGVKHFCVGTDLYILYDWMKKTGDGMRKVLESY